MKKLALVLVAVMMCFLAVSAALAAPKIEQISNIGDANDYVVGPGKYYLFMDPGQTVTKNVEITNRFKTETKFKLELEDFRGTTDGASPLELMGLLAGPYSLKDYLHPEVMEFKLQSGDRITVPVTVSIPKDAVPGGLYGSVIVTTSDEPQEAEVPPGKTKGQLPLISRVVVLYFVRVNGPVKEEGSLKDLKTDKKIYWSTNKPIIFNYSFANTGNVYLNPYGDLEIKNLYGSVVDRITVDASYVLPDSIRINNLKWDKGFSMGRYTAKLTLKRGYLGSPDQTDVKTVTFWVIPWIYIVIFLVGLLILIAIIQGIKKWFKKNFERRK